MVRFHRDPRAQRAVQDDRAGAAVQKHASEGKWRAEQEYLEHPFLEGRPFLENSEMLQFATNLREGRGQKPERQKHLFVWDVSVTAADLCPVKISMSSVRLLTWFGQGVALIMSSLSILLCWLDDSPHRFLGEGAWISFGALLMVLSSALLSGREACLSDPEEREEHWTTEDDAVDMRPRRVSFNTGPGPEPRGWSPARAVSGIEDFMTNFEEGVKAVKHEAENLQRPFLAAGEDLNARMKNFIQEMEQQVWLGSTGKD
ncbi:C2 domain-containing protein [Durusdinium trenchii]|uniref:C2 domain-containing protein n=1 Tax=Durusdinium trenchii TaxID=1381693 RepID=A0ABP0M773_9DINO